MIYIMGKLIMNILYSINVNPNQRWRVVGRFHYNILDITIFVTPYYVCNIKKLLNNREGCK
jgi:hypothetical protein